MMGGKGRVDEQNRYQEIPKDIRSTAAPGAGGTMVGKAGAQDDEELGSGRLRVRIAANSGTASIDIGRTC